MSGETSRTFVLNILSSTFSFRNAEITPVVNIVRFVLRDILAIRTIPASLVHVPKPTKILLVDVTYPNQKLLATAGKDTKENCAINARKASLDHLKAEVDHAKVVTATSKVLFLMSVMSSMGNVTASKELLEDAATSVNFLVIYFTTISASVSSM
jgi:hypothetical protein